MIYEKPANDEPLSQGDVIDDCSLLIWEMASNDSPPKPVSTNTSARTVFLTQACDLAQSKATRVQVAVVHRAQDLVDIGVLKAKTIRDQVRGNRVYGWYFLPSDPLIEESIIDLRDVHTLPRAMIDQLVKAGNRVCRIRTPYREHLAQHFTSTYARIALPYPYETDPEK